jgi:two-component system NtrC family response regulator
VTVAASSQANVLITGETGTGKEVFANVIHNNSERKEQNFVVVDCASLPEHLIESTLFGHVRGAFTGAEKNKTGLVKLADGGTLFLDEIGELPLELQKRLLRVLQERRFLPVGALKEEESDFRLIAATNRNLERCVHDGIFRRDLFYRLRAFTIELPPLRERKEDIRALTRFFLTRFCDRAQVEYKGISSEFFDHLEAHDWPGNVRELQQTLEQVFATAFHFPKLFAYHLPEHLRINTAQNFLRDKKGDKQRSPAKRERPLTWSDYKHEQEFNYWQDLMSFCDGNISKACDISGLSRARIYQLFKKYNNLSP